MKLYVRFYRSQAHMIVWRAAVFKLRSSLKLLRCRGIKTYLLKRCYCCEKQYCQLILFNRYIYVKESLETDPIYGARTFSQNLYLLCHLYLISIYVEPTVNNTWCWKISILFWNLPDQTSYHMIHVNKIQSYYTDK